MLKSSSPTKFEELPSTSIKAKFFYTGVFALTKRREELSQPKSTRPSQDKKSMIKKWSSLSLHFDYFIAAMWWNENTIHMS